MRRIARSLLICFIFIIQFDCAYSYSTQTTEGNFLYDQGQFPVTLNNQETQYTITYSGNKQFQNKPQSVVAIGTFDYYPSSPKQKFQLTFERQRKRTQLVIKMKCHQPNKVNVLKIRYFVFDQILVTFLKTFQESLKMEKYNGQPESYDIDRKFDLPQQYVNNPLISIACFLDKLEGFDVTGQYSLSITCSIMGSQFRIISNLNQNNNGQLRDKRRHQHSSHSSSTTKYEDKYVYKVIGVSIFCILKDNSLNATTGTHTAVSSGQIILEPFQYSEISTRFIGLKSFVLSDRNHNYSLSDISISGNFHYIHYDYFTIKKPEIGLKDTYLKHITTSFFDTKIQLHYLDLLNLTEIKLNQFKTNKTSNYLKNQKVNIGGVPNQKVLLLELQKPVDNDLVEVQFNYSFVTTSKNRVSKFKIVIIKQIQIDHFDKTIGFTILNTRNATIENFHYNNLHFMFLNITPVADNDAVLFFNYTTEALGIDQQIRYEDPDGFKDFVFLKFHIPKISEIKTSTDTVEIEYKYEFLQQFALLSQTSQFTQNSQFISYLQSNGGADVFVTLEYQNKDGIDSSSYQISYVWNDTIKPKLTVRSSLVTVLSIKNQNASQLYDITFINLKNPETITTSQFQIIEDGASPLSVKVVDGNLVLTVQSNHTILTNNSYSIKLNTEDCTIVVQDIKTLPKFKQISSIKDNNNLDIYLHNTAGLTSDNLPVIRLNNPYITILQTNITEDGLILISAIYNNTVDKNQLEIYFDSDEKTIYYQVVSFPLEYSFPLYYCVGQMDLLSRIYKTFATVLQYAYLVTFLYSSVCNNKLIGIQLMFSIQFAFYSMIIIGTNCPYEGLASIQFVSGINPLFSDLTQHPVPYKIATLDIYSNFLSNVNLMIYILLLCPIIYFILTYCGHKSDCYKRKPRLLKYGKSFIFQVPLTIFLFSSFNIYTSLAVQIQYFISSTYEAVVAIAFGLIIPSIAIGFYFIGKHFCQYRQEFDTSQKIGNLTVKTSSQIRQLYPIILMFQFIATPLLLSINKLSSVGLYLCLIVSMLGFIFILIATPYSHQFDNIRLILHRFIILGLCGTQIWFYILTKTPTVQGFILYIPLILLSLLALGLLLNGLNIIRVTIKWIKKKGVIDHNMMLKKQATKEKPQPIRPVVPGETIFYPKLEYGGKVRKSLPIINRKQSHFIQHQNLLNKQELIV